MKWPKRLKGKEPQRRGVNINATTPHKIVHEFSQYWWWWSYTRCDVTDTLLASVSCGPNRPPADKLCLVATEDFTTQLVIFGDVFRIRSSLSATLILWSLTEGETGKRKLKRVMRNGRKHESLVSESFLAVPAFNNCKCSVERKKNLGKWGRWSDGKWRK